LNERKSLSETLTKEERNEDKGKKKIQQEEEKQEWKNE
jgi:hypothetical protein